MFLTMGLVDIVSRPFKSRVRQNFGAEGLIRHKS